ncbi:hypothetical protein MHB65_17180 [Lysinibacillus sp. FSL K6-0075]|uniref:hypothetical protein n=1 Tax=Lysinibacillus sp. FSL K6-0075 TaxID=2921415 RepID=UPI0031589CAE
MMSTREILLKKNLLRKSFVEKKISEAEYKIALKKLEELERKKAAISSEKNANLGIFRKKLMGN